MQLAKTIVRCLAAVAIATVLAGCEGKVSVEMETQSPADLTIASVVVPLRGVEFQKDSGDVVQLEFDTDQAVDLMDFIDGNLFRLFTDEELSDGRYTGVRLLFGDDDDEDLNKVVLFDGKEFELTLGAAEFSAVNFTVDKNDSSKDNVVLTLDLRQSLPFDDSENSVVLTPVLRAVRGEDAGGIAGNAAVSCPANSSLAIYVFSGKDVTPDDFDGADVEPYLTTQVSGVSSSNTGYAFSYLPEGGYTLSSTCRGDDERSGASEDLDFKNTVSVDVEAGETTTRNIPG